MLTLTLAAALDRAGYSQIDFARHLGIPQPRVSEMVHGRRRLQPAEYKQAAELLGLSDSELLAMVCERPTLPKRRHPADDRRAA